MLRGSPGATKAVTCAATIILLCLTAHLLYSKPVVSRWSVKNDEIASSDPNGNLLEQKPGELIVDGESLTEQDVLPCQKLSGADEVVVVMRTGATEIQDKLPAHFNTTFRCYKDFIIFSDYEETFEGHPVHDVLAPINQGIKVNNPDFGLYVRLQQYGRKALLEDELSGTASSEGSKSGKGDNPGWRLDKWKFLPMMNETLRLRPNKKWYVFVESDSYLVWSNILQYLERQDPSRELYAGSEVQIGPDQFAHGGSVFVMSRPTIELAARYYAEHEDELNTWTAGHWAGDCVLGKTLRDAGIPLTWSWPMFQGGHPEKMDFSEKKGDKLRLWCTPANSYHHFSPTELHRMWHFEQIWIQSQQDNRTSKALWPFGEDCNNILEHRDVFKNFVWSNIAQRKNSWSNLSPTMVQNTAGSTFEGCRTLCETSEGCLQFASSRLGCSISDSAVMLGEPASDVTSGWMLNRIQRWIDDLDEDDCAGFEGWPIT